MRTTVLALFLIVSSLTGFALDFEVTHNFDVDEISKENRLISSGCTYESGRSANYARPDVLTLIQEFEGKLNLGYGAKADLVLLCGNDPDSSYGSEKVNLPDSPVVGYAIAIGTSSCYVGEKKGLDNNPWPCQNILGKKAFTLSYRVSGTSEVHQETIVTTFEKAVHKLKEGEGATLKNFRYTHEETYDGDVLSSREVTLNNVKLERGRLELNGLVLCSAIASPTHRYSRALPVPSCDTLIQVQ